MKLEVDITNEDILVALMRSNHGLFDQLRDSVNYEIRETMRDTIKESIKTIVDCEIKEQMRRMDGIANDVEFEIHAFIKNSVATLLKKEFNKE